MSGRSAIESMKRQVYEMIQRIEEVNIALDDALGSRDHLSKQITRLRRQVEEQRARAVSAEREVFQLRMAVEGANK